MIEHISVLLVEDSEADALLIIRQLQKGGYEPVYERVETAEAMASALQEKAWDVILCDFKLPRFNGLEALALYRECGLHIPFIIVSGAIGEEMAVEILKAGAHDYIMKDRLHRLVPAMEREMKEARARREHQILENSLLASEEKFRKFFELNPAILGISTLSDGTYVDINPAFTRQLGWEREEVIGRTSQDLGLFEDYAKRVELAALIQQGVPINNVELNARTKSGKIITGMFSASLIEVEGQACWIAQINDITEMKRAQDELSKQFIFLQTLINTIPSPIFFKDTEGRYRGGNASFEFFVGRTMEDIVGKTEFEVVPGLLSEIYHETDISLMSEGGIRQYEGAFKPATGEKRDVLYKKATFLDTAGQMAGLVGVMIDITDRKRMEIALKDSEKQFRTLTENIPDVIARYDRELRYVYVNPAITLATGLSPDSFIGKTNEELGMPKENVTLWHEQLRKVFASGNPAKLEFDFESPRGWRSFYATLVPEFDEKGLIASTLVISRDVTELQKVVDDLRQAEEKYRMIFENAREGIFRISPEGKILMANQALADNYGYDSPEDMMNSLKALNRQVYLHPADRAKLMELIDAQDYVKAYEIQQYRKDQSVLWTSISVNVVRDSHGKIFYYEGIQEDITERKMAFERMKRALDETVHAIATLVETRDPYTAGHQRRVADLAKGIALEMGFDDGQTEGVYTAGVIHDIGKVYVPAEILSKPTKLSAIEFSLIKTHAQAGYDILKDVEFPWPISRMVLEHHERIDGSGYPNGLRQEETIIESRILSVADVVESMASHRPYRPALGIESALEEIARNSGILYDPTVVDACLQLFNEKGYRIID